jgi:hypothetical protein
VCHIRHKGNNQPCCAGRSEHPPPGVLAFAFLQVLRWLQLLGQGFVLLRHRIQGQHYQEPAKQVFHIVLLTLFSAAAFTINSG